MNFKETDNKNIIEHRDGMPGVTLFISIIGAFTFMAAFGGLAKPGDPLTAALFKWGGIVFLVGLVLSLWRKGTTIDKGKKEIRLWKGFFFKPLKITAYPFKDFSKVSVKLIERRDVEETVRWYRAFVEPSSKDISPIMIFASRKKDDTVSKAKEFSNFTGIAFKDETPE